MARHRAATSRRRPPLATISRAATAAFQTASAVHLTAQTALLVREHWHGLLTTLVAG